MGRISKGLAAGFAAALVIFTVSGRSLAEEVPARPLALDECINIALGGHPRIKAAEQDLKAGEYRTEQAKAVYWPWLTFNASRNYRHYETLVRFGSTPAKTSARFVANNFAFNANWTLFDFGRTYYNVRGLSELESSLTKDLTAAEQSMAFDVVNAYFSLLQAEKLVDVANETKAASQSHLEQATAFYDVGVKPRFDVTSAEVELNNAKLGLIEAEHTAKLARVTLNTVLGYPPTAPTEVVDMPPTEKLSGSMDEYLAKALAERPELKSLEFAESSARMGVRAAYAGYLPALSASGSYSWYKEDHSDMFKSDNVMVAVDVPIFEGLKTTAALGEARARALSAGYRLEDTRRNVEVEVGAAFLGVEDAAAKIDTLVSSVKKARENLDIAHGRYEAGVGPYIEVTDAQVAFTQALTDKTRAEYEYHIAYARLLKSVGKTAGDKGLGL